MSTAKPSGSKDPKDSEKDEYKPEYITSLDCKILQYQYAITKLEVFIKSIRRLSEQCAEGSLAPPENKEPKQGLSEEQEAEKTPESKSDEISPGALPLMHYIVLLSGSVFAISENSFNAKLDLLSNFKLFKPTTINISTISSHIPYDLADTPVGILTDLPKLPAALKTMKALDSLCSTCLQAYQKRLAQAKVEQSKMIKGDASKYYLDLTKIVGNEIFCTDKDFDLTLNDLSFKLPKDKALMENENFVEASLIDIDVKMVFLLNKQIDSIMTQLRPMISMYKTLRHTPAKTIDEYALHKIFLLTLRLNDIYTIFRRFGRKIFLSNYSHLTDSKFLFQAKNGNYFKSAILGGVDDTFNTMKKNGMLIANLTRLIRQDSRFEINLKNISDLINFVNQGYLMMETSLDKFDEFGQEWIALELRFRKVYQLPRRNLFEIYQEYHEVKPAPVNTGNIKAPVPTITTSSATKTGESVLEAFPSVSKSSNAGVNGLEKSMKKLEIEPPKTRGSRSSSVSSITSNGSINKPLMRKNSLNSPNRNSMLIPPSSAANGKASPVRSRPNSMLFMNANGSMSTIEGPSPSTLTNSIVSPAATRRRSNSQPVRGSPNINDAIATSGAATALTRNNTISSPLKSPSGTVIRKPAANGVNTKSVNSPTPSVNKNQKQLNSVVEEVDSPPVNPAAVAAKLSANQRLQQHLRQAAKSGTLMTQQKEIFTSVTFDPNSPSSVPIRKYIDPPPKEVSPPAPVESPPISSVTNAAAATALTTAANTATANTATAKPRRTRDLVTRRNTQHNSVTRQIDPLFETASSSSTDSSGNTSSSGSKRVRFTGVPDYTEAEDAPTKYSHTILRNFAVFKSPIRAVSQKPTFKKKDELLKKEESLSFRYQVHHQPADEDLAA